MVRVKADGPVVVSDGFLEAAHRGAGFRPLEIERRVARVEADRLAAIGGRFLVPLQLVGVGTRPGLPVCIGGTARRAAGCSDRLLYPTLFRVTDPRLFLQECAASPT